MLDDFQYAKSEDNSTTFVAENSKLLRYKRWFKEAVEAQQKWRNVAREDREFYSGKQWADGDKKTLEDAKRPAITINRIKPLINVLSGYQRLNRYDIDFLPRTNDDDEQAQLRKGVTKYIMDRSHYNYEESDVFNDGVVTGIGWFEVGYKFDWLAQDGDAFIRRVSPFDIYADPESRDKHMRDMKYVIRARWVDKDELAAKYPQQADEINAQTAAYMTEETENDKKYNELWYSHETKKIRFAECWYKKAVQKQLFILKNGELVEQVTEDMIALGMILRQQTVTTTEIRMLAFFDNVVLEDIQSPYKHGFIPFVPFICYYQGEDDIPSGVVRDLKDPQREINKRRSQELHILNTQSNGGWIAEEGAMSPQQEASFKRNASTPGALLKVNPGALSMQKLQRLEPQAPPSNIINASQEAMSEMPSISGINEALMGTDISNSQSGRAIELKQKQAITHIAGLFDNLRMAKELIVDMLWGKRGAPGIIPQFYTEQKTFRIVGENGEPQIVTVNQQVQQQQVNPQTGMIQTITKTLNDLSVGEFDIVIADTPATSTQRTAQFWSLVDACGKLGIQGNMIMDILIDLSDIPQKAEIKRRLKSQQEEQAQAQQQQMQAQMELEKQKRLSRSIAYKDLQLPLQLQLAAQAGILPQQYADAFLQWSIQQMAQSMGMGGMQQPNMVQQGIMPQQVPQMQQIPQQPTQAAQSPLTQAAVNGLVEANKPVL